MTTKRLNPGTPTFRFERVVNHKLHFKTLTACVQCGERLIVDYGTIAATFRIGGEFLGIVCDECLDERSRHKVAQYREAGEVPR